MCVCVCVCVCVMVSLYDSMSTIVDYLMPKPSLLDNSTSI